MDQSINQSINQSIDQSINQSIIATTGKESLTIVWLKWKVSIHFSSPCNSWKGWLLISQTTCLKCTAGILTKYDTKEIKNINWKIHSRYSSMEAIPQFLFEMLLHKLIWNVHSIHIHGKFVFYQKTKNAFQFHMIKSYTNSHMTVARAKFH